MHNDRVYEIDLLRFLAATAVVMFHWSLRGAAADDLSILSYPMLIPLFKYGYLGVELFFMISGYVILMSASSGSVRDFFASRVARLYPAFVVCCTLTYAFSLAIGGHRFSYTPVQYLQNLTLMGGFFGVEPIDGAYWSLFVEMRFYAFIGVVLWLRRLRSIETIFWTWLALTIVQCFIRTGPIRTWLVADYSTYFVAGAVFFLAHRTGFSINRILLLLVSWIVSVYQSAAGALDMSIHYKVAYDPIVISIVVTGFYCAMLAISTNFVMSLRRPSWVTIGALTYPLYLLHQFIGYMIFNKLGANTNPHLLFWSTFCGMLIAAFLVQKWIERPFGRLIRHALSGSNNHQSNKLVSHEPRT